MSFYTILFLSPESPTLLQPQTNLVVNRLRWDTLGGPSEAGLTASGDLRSLNNLAQFLGYPVEIRDLHGNLTWWGFLSSVQVGNVAYDLQSMFNRVKAGYTFAVDEGGSTVVQRFFTPWVEDLHSQADYGIKEKILSLGTVSLEMAQSARDQFLAGSSRPAPHRAPDVGSGQAVLTCLGWWSTLAWQYYANPAGLESYTTTGVGTQNFGDVSADTRPAQSWQAGTAGWDLDTVWIKAAKTGSPSDALVVSLYGDAGGVPGSTLLSSGTLAGSALTLDYAWIKLTLSPVITVGTGIYWLVLTRSGSLSNVHSFKVKVNESLGYTGGVFRLWNGSAWVARSPDADLNFTLLGKRETTLQVGDIAASSACGPFLTGTRIQDPSGLYISPYRSGTLTGLQEVKALLAGGTGDGVSLLAEVLSDRSLSVHKKPEDINLVMGEDGTIRNLYGQEIRPDQVLNQWVKITWSGLMLSDSQFITRVETDGEGKIKIPLT